MEAAAMALGETLTAACATGCALTKTVLDTAVTAPATLSFAWFSVRVGLFTTLVITVCCTTVFVMFTRVM
jgi:hypothetical protein